MFNAITIVSNLVPLAGVVWFGWSAIDLLGLYWLENWVVMVFTLASVAILHARGAERMAPKKIIDFCAIFGMAGLIFGLFLFFFAPLFFGTPFEIWRQPHMIWGVAGLSVNHAVAFVQLAWGRPTSRALTPRTVLDRAFRRIPPFVFGTVICMFALAAIGSPVAGFAVLVVLKIALEVSIYRPSQRPVSVAVS